MSKSSILASILLERLLDLLTLVVLAAIGLLLFEGRLSTNYALALSGLIALLVLTIGVVYQHEKGLTLFNRLIAYFPKNLQVKLVDYATLAFKGLHSLSHPRLLGKTLLLSTLLWLTMASCNYLSMIAVGIDVPFYATFATMLLVVLASTLPNVPGQLGVIEFCYVTTLVPFGVDPSTAFAAALFFHFFLYVPVILSSPWFFKSLGLTLRKASEQAKALNSTGDSNGSFT